MLRTIIFSFIILLSQAQAKCAPDKQREHCLAFLEEYCNTAGCLEEAEKLVADQSQDGTWPDIDFNDRSRVTYSPKDHADRVTVLAGAYHETGRKEFLDAAIKALDAWDRINPVSINWWFNEIGCPQSFGPGLLLLKDDLDADRLQKAVRIMSNSKLIQTGQNKVWQAGNVLIRGLLEDDMPLVRQARDSIMSEIRIGTVEGIQPDLSFHQHGPQMQAGTYGLSFAQDMAWYAKAFKGSSLEFPEDKMHILEEYVRTGLARLVWNGYFDQNACGRRLTENTQKEKGEDVEEILHVLDIDPGLMTGGLYFPCSDFGIYRTGEWYASIRMQSNRTMGVEMVNYENMKGYFASDGALLTRTEGDEYFDIAPLWNWKHIPGVTAYDNGKELWGIDDRTWPYNKTDKVFGKAGDRYMVAAMDYDRDGLKARKAWFFCPEGIICLGAGINLNEGWEVTTTVEQNLLKGEVETGRKWIRHRGTTYIPLCGTRFTRGPVRHTGSWKLASAECSDEEVSGDVFELFIDHGKAPSGESYAYAVIPASKSGRSAWRKVRRQVRVRSNDTDRQTVKIGRTRLEIDWSTGEITIR